LDAILLAEVNHERFHVHFAAGGVLRRDLCPRGRVRAADAAGGQAMTWIYVVGGIVAAALLIYLLCALLKPEWFQ
jgi:K+-transporting ATPase KdpF subunit